MLRKIKLAAVTLLIAVTGLTLVAPTLSMADPVNSDACAGLNTLQNNSNGSKCPTGSDSQLNHLISFVVQTLSWVLGVAAVIVIIASGFKYITSGGDSSKIGSAKQTLIYALIGLIVAALAQFLVHFVINGANGAVTPCSSSQPSIAKTDPKCKTP